MMHPAWLSWPETQTLIKLFDANTLRFVGGAVRDSLLGREVIDVDAATTLLPHQVQALLEKGGVRAIPTGIAHGTVTALVGGKHFEITTLRKDVATDGRHAEVAFTDNWQEDAQRRDFTMNALYLSPAGELFDYFSGESDARAGRVVFIGNAGQRIQEDYLRILRFFRFYAHYGKGTADKKALEACTEFASGLGQISGERIQFEMLRLLTAHTPSTTIEMMQRCGVNAFATKTELNALIGLETLEQLLGGASSPIVRLASLLGSPSAIEPLAQRWKISGELKKQLQLLLGEYVNTKPLSTAEQKALLRKLGAQTFKQLVWLLWARAGAQSGMENYAPMAALADSWAPPSFPISGQDLLAKGMQEGKEMGEKLRAMEARWEASDYRLTKEELLK